MFTRHGAREELQDWVKNAYWYMLSEYTVPWLAAESQYGWELALEWIDSTEEGIASSGWSTLSNLVSLATEYIKKIEDKGYIGKKRKAARC